MRTIFLPPQAGKTYALIDIAHREGLYIVTINIKEARRIFELSRKIDKPIRFPLTFEDMKRGKFFSENSIGLNKLLIDNADEYIKFMCPISIHTITLTRNKGDLF